MRARVDDIHYELSTRAANLANLALVEDPRIPPQFINLFQAAGNRTLGLSFSEAVNSLDNEVVQVIREIGKASLKQALMDNPDLFVGVILGEARRGKNYFREHHN